MAFENEAPVVGAHAVDAGGPPHVEDVGFLLPDLLQLGGAWLSDKRWDVQHAPRVESRLQAGVVAVFSRVRSGWLASAG